MAGTMKQKGLGEGQGKTEDDGPDADTHCGRWRCVAGGGEMAEPSEERQAAVKARD